MLAAGLLLLVGFVLWERRRVAREYGQAGRRRYREMGIGWGNTLSCLLG